MSRTSSSSRRRNMPEICRRYRFPDSWRSDAGICAYLLNFFPGWIGIESANRPGLHVRLLAEILLINFTFVTGDERHDSGVSVIGGPGDDGKSANELSIHDIIDRA